MKIVEGDHGNGFLEVENDEDFGKFKEYLWKIAREKGKGSR